jgi:hypothetical protein
MVIVRSFDIHVPPIKDSFQRRSVLIRNKIVASLKRIDVPEDDIIIVMEMAAMKNLPAEVTWYLDGYKLSFKYAACNKFVENLYVIAKLLEEEVAAIFREEKSLDDFINDFVEANDAKEQRKEARELLGVPADCMDMALITKQYKSLAKKIHPDMQGGDLEQFKALNHAHKLLLHELH